MEDGIAETLTCCYFSNEHWTRIYINHVIERLNEGVRCYISVVDSSPDGNSSLMLVHVGARHVACPQWANKKYMNLNHLKATLEDASIAD